MSALRTFIARVPVGWSSITLLMAMLLVYVAWPASAIDRLPDEAMSPTSLAMDRMQLRLTSQMLTAAVAGRSAENPAYGVVVNQMRVLQGYLPKPPQVVRLWVSDGLFNPQTPPLPARHLVLLYECEGEAPMPVDDDTARGRPAELIADRARRVPLTDEAYGQVWQAMETIVQSRAVGDGEFWHVRATAPVLDMRGRTQGLIEAEYVWPRSAPWPQWPRTAMLVALVVLLVLLVEVRDATLRRLLRAVGLKVPVTVLRYEPPMSRREEAVRGRIDKLASRAESSDRHWLMREPQPQRTRETQATGELASLPQVRLPLNRRRSSAIEPATGVTAAPVAVEPESLPEAPEREAPGQVLAAATIEDERLLASVLEMLLPHVAADGQTALGEELRAGDLSLRVTIEIRRRQGEEKAAEGSE